MSDCEVSILPGTHEVNTIALLEAAKSWDADHIVVIGLKFDEDGTETMVGTSCSDIHRCLGFVAAGMDEVNRMRTRKHSE